MIRAVSTITAKDLRQRLRDRSFFLLGILTPLALAFVLDLVFGGLGEGELEVRMGVSDADGSAVSRQLTERVLDLDGQGGLQVTAVAASTGPSSAIADDELDAVVVVPPGFGASVTSPPAGQAQLRLIQDPDRSVQAGVAESVVEDVAAEVQRNRLLVAAGSQLGVTVEPSEPPPRAELTSQGPGSEGLAPGSRMAAGMAVMFVFFTVQFGVTTLIGEREAGTMTRLLAAPIPRDAIVVSKGLVSYVLGVLATMILMVAAALLLGAEWGSWLGVFVLVLAAVSTAVALMAVVAGIARTSEGASAAQSIIAVGLAMLGGSWFPVSGEGLFGAVARLTPHYWFLGGLEDLAGSDSWTVVGAPVAAMVTIAVVAGVPAAVLLRGRLQR